MDEPPPRDTRRPAMASAASRLDLVATARFLTPVVLGSVGYAAWRVDWRVTVHSFLTGPGRSSRIMLLLFAIFNWKSLPLAWTYRVFSAIAYHSAWRKSPQLSPRALFKPIISETRAPLLEIDYNLHKSNSTYFADLDVSRSHLVSFLCRPALRQLARNAQTRLVLDDAGKPIAGAMTIALGAVACSFKREIAAYKPYQLWSRVLSWDRKWLYIVTHFVPRGAARPTHWLDPRLGGVATRRPGAGGNASAAPDGGWEAKMHATAVSKYVFKLGRLTVHPAIVLAASGLLPDRPGGWTSGDGRLGDESADLGDVDLSDDGDWDWRRVEAQRRKGMQLARQFQGLDDMHALFDGGDNGALGNYGPG